jgi:hypothetical protein
MKIRWPLRATSDRGPFLYQLKGTPAEHKAGLRRAIANGWLALHESGTYVKFTEAGAQLFAQEGPLSKIMISRAGSFRRPVIVIGRWALKFARNARGRACNKYEANLYRSTANDRRKLLCPVLWISPGGRLLIMAAAEPMTEMMSLDEYQ